MTERGGDKEGQRGRGEREGRATDRGTDRGGEKDREGRRAKRGDRQGGGTDREGVQTGRGDIHRGRHSLPLVGGGLIRRLSTGGHLCQRCPSSFVVVVRHGHHRPWVGHHRPGGRSFRIAFHSVIVCKPCCLSFMGARVVVCTDGPVTWRCRCH